MANSPCCIQNQRKTRVKDGGPRWRPPLLVVGNGSWLTFQPMSSQSNQTAARYWLQESHRGRPINLGGAIKGISWSKSVKTYVATVQNPGKGHELQLLKQGSVKTLWHVFKLPKIKIQDRNLNWMAKITQ